MRGWSLGRKIGTARIGPYWTTGEWPWDSRAGQCFSWPRAPAMRPQDSTGRRPNEGLGRGLHRTVPSWQVGRGAPADASSRAPPGSGHGASMSTPAPSPPGIQGIRRQMGRGRHMTLPAWLTQRRSRGPGGDGGHSPSASSGRAGVSFSRGFMVGRGRQLESVGAVLGLGGLQPHVTSSSNVPSSDNRAPGSPSTGRRSPSRNGGAQVNTSSPTIVGVRRRRSSSVEPPSPRPRSRLRYRSPSPVQPAVVTAADARPSASTPGPTGILRFRRRSGSPTQQDSLRPRQRPRVSFATSATTTTTGLPVNPTSRHLPVAAGSP